MPVTVQFISDLHVDFAGGDLGARPTGADLTVNVGDLGNGTHKYLARWLDPFLNSGSTVAFIDGNHGAYREGTGADRAYTLQSVQDECRRICERMGAHYLENDAITGVGRDGTPWRLFGATLWSDFSIRPEGMSPKQAMAISQRGYVPSDERPDRYGSRPHNDYVAVHRKPGKRLTPSDTLSLHTASLIEIADFLSEPLNDGVTIVATHFPPTAHFAGEGDHSWLYGSSDMESFMYAETAPDLWVCGHVHRSADMMVGSTRLVSNPRGYPDPKSVNGFENANWDPELVIEFEPRPAPAPAPGM